MNLINSKIIGFLVSPTQQKLDIDFFNVGLRVVCVRHQGCFIYFWGTGQIEECKVSDKYSLSFPLHDSLLDRNVLLSLTDRGIRIENDWLGSIPVFYNAKRKIVSTLISLCLPGGSPDIEGIFYFLKYGYSVYSKTIYSDIHFMRYFSTLHIDGSGMRLEYKADPVLKPGLWHSAISVDTLLYKMGRNIREMEQKTGGDIILPLSGGYDSRFLAVQIAEKKRLRSFTYGISQKQFDSTEVVYAKKVAEILGFAWKRTHLDSFNKYISDWFSIFGASTHLHGMYHIEFFKRIIEESSFTKPTFLSGVIGDLWSGRVSVPEIRTSEDMLYLAYTHGLAVRPEYFCFEPKAISEKDCFLEYEKYFTQWQVRLVSLVRTKLLLLSYLLTIPEYFGWPAWTPFLSFDNAVAMLQLPEHERKGRLWQRNFFRRKGVLVEEMGLATKPENALNFSVMRVSSLPKLKEASLNGYLVSTRIYEINSYLQRQGVLEVLKFYVMKNVRLNNLLNRLKIENKALHALHEYYVLKALEMGLSQI